MGDNTITLDRILFIAIYLLFMLTNRHTFFNCIFTGIFAYNAFYLIKNKFKIKLKNIILIIFIHFFCYFFIKDPNPFYYLLTFYLPMPNFFRAIFIIMFVTYFFNNHIFKKDENNEELFEKEEKPENELKKEEELDNKKGGEKKTEENIIEGKIIEEKVEKSEEEKKEEEENKIMEENRKLNEEKIDENLKENEIKKIKNKKYFLSREINFLWNNKLSLLNLIIALILLRIFIYIYDIKLWIYFANKEKILSFNNTNTNINITNGNSTKPQTVYYISAVIYNIEPIIKDWIDEMKSLIDYLGPENVIVSIYENGDSTDKTRKYLDFFESYLINHKVVNVINLEKLEEKEGVDRIRFLARLRNRSLDLLYRIADLDFDNTKIIFLNDIIYRFEDIIKLLATNNGNYDSVCAMDYYESFYDTWAAIGLDGKQFRRYFPYFYNKEQQDAYINGEPIRTFSCWNGVTVINAKAFEDRDKLFFRTGKKIRQSECTLLHADMYFMGYRKVLVNTQIAVAYTYEYYYKNHYLYPWTKNLITYFYYYFKYGFIKRNYNLTNLVDNDIEMDDNLDQVVLEYMIKY